MAVTYLGARVNSTETATTLQLDMTAVAVEPGDLQLLIISAATADGVTPVAGDVTLTAGFALLGSAGWDAGTRDIFAGFWSRKTVGATSDLIDVTVPADWPAGGATREWTVACFVFRPDLAKANIVTGPTTVVQPASPHTPTAPPQPPSAYLSVVLASSPDGGPQFQATPDGSNGYTRVIGDGSGGVDAGTAVYYRSFTAGATIEMPTLAYGGSAAFTAVTINDPPSRRARRGFGLVR